MISPDPLLVIGPNPAMPSVKMLGNMMELKNPHSTRLQMATCPLVAMERSTMAAAGKPKMPSSFPDFTLVRIQEPSRRPTSAPNQQREPRIAAISTSVQGPSQRVTSAPNPPSDSKKEATFALFTP